jgi:hypothetical protein
MNGDMSGEPESETPFIEDDRAHAASASTLIAKEAYGSLEAMLGGSEGSFEGGWWVVVGAW